MLASCVVMVSTLSSSREIDIQILKQPVEGGTGRKFLATRGNSKCFILLGTREAQVGGSLRVPGQLGLQGRPCEEKLYSVCVCVRDSEKQPPEKRSLSSPLCWVLPACTSASCALVLVSFLATVVKDPDQGNLREKGLILVHGSRDRPS